MNIEEITANLWGDFSAQAQPHYCAYAARFKQWTETLCASVGEAARYGNAKAAVAVNQAKVLLVDKYFEWRAAAPKAHRNRTGEGHTCLFHVFDETYRTLRAIELSLTPPLLFLPPPPPPRVPKTLSIADVVSFGGLLPETTDE
jgi:hypothetical protein